MSAQDYQEFIDFDIALSQVQLDPGTSDKWSTIWKDGQYSAHRYYQHCFKDIVASPVYG